MYSYRISAVLSKQNETENSIFSQGKSPHPPGVSPEVLIFQILKCTDFFSRPNVFMVHKYSEIIHGSLKEELKYFRKYSL